MKGDTMAIDGKSDFEEDGIQPFHQSCSRQQRGEG